MTKTILRLAAFFFFAFFTTLTSAQRIPTIEFFHGATCPHCLDQKKWFPELKELYPDVRINEYEVWFNAENKRRMDQELAARNATASGVPVTMIESDVIVGFSEVTKARILATLEKHYGPPSKPSEMKPSEGSSPRWESFLKKPWPVMSLLLGLIDGFNPCAMWSLFVLLGFLLGMPDKRKRWLIGGIFIASSGLLYFGALLAYLLSFEGISAFIGGGSMQWIFRGVGALAVFTGAKIAYSARRAQIECTVKDADGRKKFSQKMQDILNKKNIWIVLLGVIGLAFSVNSIELLCSFAIPTTFTATLVNLDLPFALDLTGIFLYTFTYILDDLLVFLIAMWTMSLKVFSPKIVQVSHMVGGALLLLLGGAMIVKPDILVLILG